MVVVAIANHRTHFAKLPNLRQFFRLALDLHLRRGPTTCYGMLGNENASNASNASNTSSRIILTCPICPDHIATAVPSALSALSALSAVFVSLPSKKTPLPLLRHCLGIGLALLSLFAADGTGNS